jgi:hypothetical protein
MYLSTPGERQLAGDGRDHTVFLWFGVIGMDELPVSSVHNGK